MCVFVHIYLFTLYIRIFNMQFETKNNKNNRHEILDESSSQPLLCEWLLYSSSAVTVIQLYVA